MSRIFDVRGAGRADALRAAADAITAGKLVVVPTDTIYGVAADAFNPFATAMIFRAKRRTRSLPLPVLVAQTRQAWALCDEVPPEAVVLAERFWPGPLTIVVRQEPGLTWELGENEGKVALRIPKQQELVDLIGMTGPLAVTSANLSGEPTPRAVRDVARKLGSAVEIYLDAGESADDTASTIVDLTGAQPAIVRQGAITAHEISAALRGEVPAPPPAPPPAAAAPEPEVEEAPPPPPVERDRPREVYHLNATILPYGKEPIDLWIADGRITFEPQDNAQDLAVRKGFVLPGLVDAHAHITMDYSRKGLRDGSDELVLLNLEDHLQHGILRVRDMGAWSDAAFRRAASLLPPTYASTTFLAPPGGFFEDFEHTVPESGLVEAAQQQVRSGARWLAIIGDWFAGEGKRGAMEQIKTTYPPEAIARTVAAAHSLGAQVGMKAMAKEAAVIAIESGVNTIEHGWGLDSGLVDKLAGKGVAWTPTVGTLLQLAKDAIAEDWPLKMRVLIRDSLERVRTLVPQAQRLKVPILAGTCALPHGAIAEEVGALNQVCGLDPLDALAAASSAARAYLGEPAIGEGMPADLVLFRYDPRESPQVLGAPAMVMLRGRKIALKITDR